MTPRIHDDIPAEPLPGAGRVMGIGVYDGVHLGHQAVIRRVIGFAREEQARSVLLTFDRLPEELLRPHLAPKRLMSLQDKIDAIAALGPDEIVIAHVRPELLNQTAETFTESTLHAVFRPRRIVVGRDFRYGKGGRGNAATLKEAGETLGFRVSVVDPVGNGGEKISSTRIRGLITGGDVEEAERLLSRPYRLAGEVTEGRRLGRTIGFPTANLRVNPHHLIPARGVYAARAFGDDFARDAAVNIGVRPTVSGEGETVEAHLIDFDGDLYGQEVRIEFASRLRDEIRFPSLDDLRRQLAADVAETRRRLNDRP